MEVQQHGEVGEGRMSPHETSDFGLHGSWWQLLMGTWGHSQLPHSDKLPLLAPLYPIHNITK